MSTKHIIALNGPPGSGKDTVAELLLDNRLLEGKRVAVLKFAQPLREIVTILSGIPDEEIDREKTRHLGPFYTMRQLMIDLSEKLIKPNISKNYFALTVADEIIESEADVVFITDAGFQYEIESCFEALYAEDKDYRFFVWQIEREGASFDGDSRHRVYPSYRLASFNTVFENISNNGTMADFENKVAWSLVEALSVA